MKLLQTDSLLKRFRLCLQALRYLHSSRAYGCRICSVDVPSSLLGASAVWSEALESCGDSNYRFRESS